jgi:hypothetical protein
MSQRQTVPLTPCCGKPLVEQYLITALCSGCTKVYDLRQWEAHRMTGEMRLKS